LDKAKEELVLAGRWCWYCNCETEEVTGKEIYQHRSDLHAKLFFRCVNSQDHYVGRYHGSGKSYGIIADAELRKLKMEGHKHFDLLWSGPAKYFESRQAAYDWLSAQMNIPIERTHFGMFFPEMCIRATEICKRHIA
ncbi:MAG: zinc-finger-containing protein, partial [Bacteroidota bacterium]